MTDITQKPLIKTENKDASSSDKQTSNAVVAALPDNSPFYPYFNQLMEGAKKTMSLRDYTYTRDLATTMVQMWRDTLPADTLRSGGGFFIKSTTIPSGRYASYFDTFNLAGLALPIDSLSLCGRNVLTTATISRLLKASPTINTFTDAFNGGAMTGTITSNLRTDTEHYAANVPVNLARSFGGSPGNVEVGSDVSLPYLKTLLYILSLAQETFTSTTADVCVANVTTAFDFNAPVLSRFWPFSISNAAAQPVINARIVTMEDYTKQITGNIAPVAGWLPSTWGNTTAIVPIRVSDCSNATLNALWPLPFLQYPYRYRYTTSNMLFNRAVVGLNQSVTAAHSSLISINGPVARVLFVVVDNMNRGTDFVLNVGLVNVLTANNYLDAGGADVAIGVPITAALGQFDYTSWLAVLARMQEYFPDYKSYRSALIQSSELSWNFPKPDALRDNLVGDVMPFGADNAGNIPFAVAAGLVLVTVANYQNSTAVMTSPFGATLSRILAVPGFENVRFPGASHSVTNVDHRVICAYASRYYSLAQDSFAIPAQLATFLSISYRLAMQMASARDCALMDRGFPDLINHGLLQLPVRGASTLNSLQSMFVNLCAAIGTGMALTFTPNQDVVAINALRARVIVATTVKFPCNRLSLRTIAYYFDEKLSERVPSQQTVSLKTEVSGTRVTQPAGIATRYNSFTFRKGDESLRNEIFKLLSQVTYASPLTLFVQDNGLSVNDIQALPMGSFTSDISFFDALAFLSGNLNEKRCEPVAYGLGTMFNLLDFSTGNSCYLVNSAITKNIIHPNKGLMNESFYWKTSDGYDIYNGITEDSEHASVDDIFGSGTAAISSFRGF